MTASVGRPLVALARPWRGRLVLVGLGVLAAAVLDVVPPLVIPGAFVLVTISVTANA